MGGYGQELAVLTVGLPSEDQVKSGSCNYTLPVMVACQGQWVTWHIHPIVHSPSEMLKAIYITQVHPWVGGPRSVTLLLLAAVPLPAVE